VVGFTLSTPRPDGRDGIIHMTLRPSFFLALLTLAMSTSAAAQHAPLPRTINFVDNATKEIVATATIWDGKAYFRDKNGRHYATVVFNTDGTRTTYDPGGNVINIPDLPSVPRE